MNHFNEHNQPQNQLQNPLDWDLDPVIPQELDPEDPTLNLDLDDDEPLPAHPFDNLEPEMFEPRMDLTDVKINWATAVQKLQKLVRFNGDDRISTHSFDVDQLFSFLLRDIPQFAGIKMIGGEPSLIFSRFEGFGIMAFEQPWHESREEKLIAFYRSVLDMIVEELYNDVVSQEIDTCYFFGQESQFVWFIRKPYSRRQRNEQQPPVCDLSLPEPFELPPLDLEWDNSYPVLTPQSDSPTDSGEAGSAIEIMATHNVDLVENRGDLKGDPAMVPVVDARLDAFTQPPEIFGELTSRWNNLGTFQWSTGDSVGKIIQQIDLPLDILPKLESNPALLPALQYMFWRPQITARFQLNSTRFHSGGLIVGVQYYSGPHPKTGKRRVSHANQIWQLDYATLRAASSNIAEISIPYKSFLDALPIRGGSYGSASYYATIYVGVIGGLGIGIDGSQTVNVTTQVKLECSGTPTEFYSQFTRTNILTPQGNVVSNAANTVLGIVKPVADVAGAFIPGASLIGEAADIASGLVENVVKPIEGLFGGAGRSFPASNMDKVPIPIDASPLLNYPTASLSWGEGPTPGRSLRLNPATTTPHHPQTTPIGGDLLRIGDLALKWSYLDMFTIRTSDEAHALLWSTPITPLASPRTGKGYLPTALAGVSGQFTYWSGQLEYKFIALKADPHSFRLRFASNPTMEAKSNQQVDLPSEVIDFQEINEFTLVPPYFGPTHITPTTYRNSACALGTVQVSLENPLVSINSCSSTIDVVVLVRAHDNFELSIPRNIPFLPMITTETDPSPPPTVLNNTVNVVGTAYVRVYEPGAHGFNLTAVTLAQQLVDSKFIVYGRPTQPTVWMFALTKAELKDEFNTSAWFENPSTVLAASPSMNLDTDLVHDIIDLSATNPGTKFHRVKGVFLYPITISKASRVLEPQSSTEREENTVVEGPPQTVRGSQTELILGETTSLRSSLRRYTTELSGTFVAPEEGMFELVVDVNFGALTARTQGTPVSNLTFNHDAFRFSKGGLSYLFNIRNTRNNNLKIKAMHIPGGLHSTYELIPMWKVSQYASNPEYYMFASDVVATPQTSVPIHVPYYNYVNTLVNSYDPTTSGYGAVAAYSQGKLVFSADLFEGDSFSWELLRALGDDADLYCFQGWPICTEQLPVIQMNSVRPLLRTNLHSMQITPPRSVESLQPQSESQGQDFCKIPAVSHETQLISNLITEFSNSRRGRRALKKFFAGLSNLTPQNQSELPAGQLSKINDLLAEMIVCYNEKKGLISIIPPFALHYLNPADVEQSRAEWHADDDLHRRKVLNTMANALAAAFSNINIKEYFVLTKQEAKTRTWTESLIGALASTTGLIPTSLKQKLRVMGEVVKGNAFFQVMKALTETFSDLTNLNLVISCLQMILKATDMWVKSMALVMLLTHFGFLDSQRLGLAMLVNQLVYALTPHHINFRVMGLPNLVPQSDDASDTVAQWVSALMAGTAAVCGLKSAKTWAGGVESFTRNLGTVGNGIHRLLTSSCKCVLDYIVWLLGIESPETIAIAELKQVNIEAADWAQQVLQIVDPSRRSEVLASPTQRAKVSELYAQGSVFIRALVEDKSRPESTGTFLNIWRSLVELFGETGEMPDSVKANMPPLCVWIDGKPGIGKSEVAKRVARDIALLLNISYDGDPFFVRTPRKYWDGYNAQPVIIFDDAMQIQSPEILSQFYSDWYGIMTNAPFSPEFSSISEKKKFVTPQIVIVCANAAYPKVEGISTPSSFYRRRDFLLEAKISEHIKTNYGREICSASDIRIPMSELENFNHLRFGQYADPVNRNSAVTGCWTVTELIKEMKPRIEHLVKIRTASALQNVEASKSLRADTIEATRGALLRELEALNTADQVVSNLTKAYSEVTGDSPSVLQEESGDDGPSHSGKVWRDGPKSSKMCLFACDKVVKQPGGLKCFCDVPEEDFKHMEYCTMHGGFVFRKTPRSMGGMAGPTPQTYALGFFSGCRKDDRRQGFDKCLRGAIDNISAIGLQDRIPLPPFMEHSIHPPPYECDPEILAEVHQVSTWLAMKRKLKVWLTIGLKYLVPLALGFGILFACRIFDIFGKIKSFFSPDETPKTVTDTKTVLTPLPQLASSGSVSTRGTPSVKHVLRAVSAQMSSEDVTKMILKNKVKWTVTYEDGVRKSVYGLGIFGRHILLPHHVFVQYNRKIILWQLTLFPKNCEPKVFEFREESHFSFTQINGTDLALMEILSRRIPMFKDITKTFLRKEDLGKVTRSGMLIDITRDQTTILPLNIKPEEFVSQYNFEHGVQTVAMVGYSYPYERAGLCGSILIDSYHGWIIGMHVAGQSGTGYSNIVSSVFFENIVRPVKDVLEPELEAGGIVELEGNFLPLGKVLDAQAVTLPLKTNIRKSVCHGVVAPPTRLPVKMITPGEPKPGLTKLKIALEKGGIPTQVWPQTHVDKAKATLSNRIRTFCPPVTTAVGRRSFEEAICGVPNVPFANPLKRTSSVGWPLCTLKKGTKKGDFVKFRDTADGLKIEGVSPDLVDDYNRMHALRVNGIVPWSPFLNFLKDERLKPGKNPRLINGSSFSQTIDTRRYTLDFVSALQSNSLDVGIGIGLNVHGFQWSDLARRLLSVSDNICCGDYSGFGPGLDTELVYCAYDIINEWYEQYQTEDRERLPEDHTVRLTLAENLAFSCELSMDTMIKTLQGSPSGNDLTAVINSIVNHLMLMLVWQRAFEGTTIQEPHFLYQLCYPVVYGDDVIMSVHDSVVELFNNEVLNRVFAEIGVKYTDADKSGNIRKYCPLSEASFLKCSFVQHPTRGYGTYLGALDKDVIEDIPNWIHAAPDAESASFENCVQACRFAYAWGFDYYAEVQNRLISFWRSRGRPFPVESWEYLDTLFFGELRGVALPKTIDPLNYAWA